MTKKLLMGNEAFAHAALEAGVRVVAGYPGTPSSELVETVARLHAQGVARGVHVEWSTNEKAALELAAAAAYCGARALFTCKQVGLNVASDALMSLNYVGVEGGLVLFVADDPGPISSQTEQDTRRFAAFAKVPVLDPATPEQGFAMMKAAFDLSERYRTPVIVRPTTRINHASTFFDVADVTEARPIPAAGFVKNPDWVIFPKRSFEAHGEINRRLNAMAQDFSDDAALVAFNPVVEGGKTAASMPPGAGAENASVHVGGASDSGVSARLGIMAGGASVAYAREALDAVARMAESVHMALPPYRFMQVGTPYPFPEEAAARFAEGLDAVLVLEELDYVLEDAMLRLVGKRHLSADVCGKLTGDAAELGENTVEDIEARISTFFDRCAGRSATATTTLSALVEQKAAAPFAHYEGSLPVRPPVLCAGCPHRGSFYAVKRALGGQSAVLCGDIGCYTLGNAAPLDAVDTCLCMGAGITMAQGFSVVEPHKKQVAFVGDSTFFASGLTGVANAVYNQHDITVCVLDNATTAMTGAQPHPGTGVTLMGARHEPIDIEAVLHALGVAHIAVVDPLEVDGAVAAAREAIAFDGPAAVIFRSPCVQLKRAEPALAVDSQTCTGCKKCITSIGCPGIGFSPDVQGPRSKDRGQAFVDADLCNGCGLCTQLCPTGSIASVQADVPSKDPNAGGAIQAEGGRA